MTKDASIPVLSYCRPRRLVRLPGLFIQPLTASDAVRSKFPKAASMAMSRQPIIAAFPAAVARLVDAARLTTPFRRSVAEVAPTGHIINVGSGHIHHQYHVAYLQEAWFALASCLWQYRRHCCNPAGDGQIVQSERGANHTMPRNPYDPELTDRILKARTILFETGDHDAAVGVLAQLMSFASAEKCLAYMTFRYVDMMPDGHPVKDESHARDAAKQRRLYHTRKHRQTVIGRDGGRCQRCGKEVSGRNATLDHIDPDGPSQPDNLRLYCRSTAAPAMPARIGSVISKLNGATSVGSSTKKRWRHGTSSRSAPADMKAASPVVLVATCAKNITRTILVNILTVSSAVW